MEEKKSEENSKKDLIASSITFFLKCGTYLEAAAPYFNLISQKFFMLKSLIDPFHPRDLFSIVWGFIMIYFGGHFLITIAAFEAYRLFSWENTKSSFYVLYVNYINASYASKKDDEIDDDNDDVNQISKQQLIRRKVSVVFKTIDPLEVTNAFNAIAAGTFAVVATLRSQFANAITLGASLGEMLSSCISPIILPVVESAVPEHYHKWIPVVIHYTASSVGMSLAFFLQRVISAFHASSRGSFMFATGLLNYLLKHGHIEKSYYDSNKKFYMIAASFIGITGFLWQVFSGFTLYFPLNILLLPLRVVEYLLTHIVGTAST